MDEAELIAALLEAANADPNDPEQHPLGPGDDAAILRPPAGHDLVWTTDDQVEGVHFRAAWASDLGWAAIGRKAAGASLSDLAAMGARPWGALLSLGLPPGLEAAAVIDLARGLGRKLTDCGCPLLGGNVTRAPGGLVISISCLGVVPQGRALRRSAGRPGDDLFVSGPLGLADAGLRALLDSPARPDDSNVARLFDPIPRLGLGARLARFEPAPACMDLSDGLARDLPRLLTASGCAATVDIGDLPGPDPRAAWEGGEDYQLLVAGSPQLGAAEPTLIRIGALIRGAPGAVTLVNAPPDLGPGFDHLSR